MLIYLKKRNKSIKSLINSDLNVFLFEKNIGKVMGKIG